MEGEDDQKVYAASVGSMMVGLLLASVLGGCVTLQTALYFSSTKSDHWLHKISVGFLWILASLQLSFIFHATYHYTITLGVNDPDVVEFVWSFKLQLFLQTLIMSVTKILYTIRIWKLRDVTRMGKRVVIGLCGILVVDYGLSAFFAYKITTIHLLRDIRLNFSSSQFKLSAFLAMVSNCVTDVTIGALLVYTLVKSRPSLGWTNSSWTMLAAYALNTGIITGVFSTVTLIGFSIGVANPLYIVFEMVLPQLYMNCYLSMLNASYYFQTKSSLDLSFSYRTPSVYSIEVPRFGHSDVYSSFKLQRRDRTIGSVDSDISLGKSPETINELGMPLFGKGSQRRLSESTSNPPLEVRVDTTTMEYSIDRRLLEQEWNTSILNLRNADGRVDTKGRI